MGEWRAKYGDDRERAFRHKYETEMIEKFDTHFYVATIHQHQGTWIIRRAVLPAEGDGTALRLTHLLSVASPTIRAAASFTSLLVCPGLCALSKCSANATLMDGFTSCWNGYPQTEHRFMLPAATNRGGSSSFAIPRVYAEPNWIQSSPVCAN